MSYIGAENDLIELEGLLELAIAPFAIHADVSMWNSATPAPAPS
jgi:hypothetical protein